MKTGIVAIVVVALGLSGCAVSMEELVAQANETGDWSAVEAKLERQEQRAARAEERRKKCAGGTVSVKMQPREARCMDARQIEAMLRPAYQPFGF